MAMSPDEEQAFLETFLTYTGMLSTNTLHANLVRGGHHVSTATLVKTENEDAVGAGRTARTPTPATPTRGFGTPKTPIGVAKLTDGGEKAVQALFEAYSSWGSRPNSTYMEFPKFAKLCRDRRVFGFRVSLATARQTFCVARQSKHDPSLLKQAEEQVAQYVSSLSKHSASERTKRLKAMMREYHPDKKLILPWLFTKISALVSGHLNKPFV